MEHCSVTSGDWPMLGHDPSHKYSDNSIRPPLEKVWEFKAGGGIMSSPVPAQGKVFFGCKDKRLYALYADTGRLAWAFKTGGEIVGSPIVANKTVYFSSKDRNLYAVDAEEGKKIWQFSNGKNICEGNKASPATASDLIFFGSEDGKVHALDATNGQQVWIVQTDFSHFSAPTVAEGIVLIVAESRLYAFDIHDGSIVWSHDGLFVSHVWDLCPPTVIKSRVIVPAATSVDMLDLKSGSRLGNLISWNEQIHSERPCLIAANDDWVVIGMGTEREYYRMKYLILKHLYLPECYFARTREIQGLDINNSPVITQGFMFIGSSTLFCLKMAEPERWELNGANINDNVTPAAGFGLLFAVTKTFPHPKGKMYALKSMENTALRDSHEGENVATAARFSAYLLARELKWPNICCLCCGPAETSNTITKTYRPMIQKDIQFSVNVPYCRDCERKLERWGGLKGKEEPAVKFGYDHHHLLFRNQEYWTQFMEANKLR